MKRGGENLKKIQASTHMLNYHDGTLDLDSLLEEGSNPPIDLASGFNRSSNEP